jgi:hypothetical protein
MQIKKPEFKVGNKVSFTCRDDPERLRKGVAEVEEVKEVNRVWEYKLG